MLFQKESPHWLVRQGGRTRRAHVLRAGAARRTTIEDEMAQDQGVAPGGRRVPELLVPSVRPLLIVGVLLAVFQQITGINTVIYYAPTLLASAGLGSSAALLANVVNGFVNVGMTIVAIWLLDRVGRRPLLITGTAAWPWHDHLALTS